MNKERLVNLLREEFELYLSNHYFHTLVKKLECIQSAEEQEILITRFLTMVCKRNDEVEKELFAYKMLYGELKDNDKI